MMQQYPFLSRLGDAVNQGMGDYRARQSMQPDEMTLKLMQANPAFAQQYQQATANRFEMDEKTRQRSELARIGEAVRSGSMAPKDALMALGIASGDASMFGKAVAPTDTGATGALVQKVMEDNPGMTYTEALYLVQTGFRQNTRLDPSTNQIGAAPGAPEALGALKGGETYGGEAGKLQAQGELAPGVEADIAAAKSDAEFTTKGRQGLIKAQRSLQSRELAYEYINKKIDSIYPSINEFTTGMVGTLVSQAPGTPAYNLKQQIDTILANAGFDKLQEMRDNSPTGGALGQVTERELELLQKSVQSIMLGQSGEQITENLKMFQEQYKGSIDNIRAAYEQDYARFGGKDDPYLPPPSVGAKKQPETKRKRYNPATGQLE